MKNINQPYHGAFQVRIVKEGKERSLVFNFCHWGGKKKALSAAKNWRDQLKIILKINEKRLKPQSCFAKSMKRMWIIIP